MKIKDLRKQKNLTQVEIAAIFHVHVNTFKKWENEINPIPVEKIKEIAAFFGVNPSEIMYYTQKKDIKNNEIINIDIKMLEHFETFIVKLNNRITYLEQADNSIDHLNELRDGYRLKEETLKEIDKLKNKISN